jgi:hypothetical protein
VTTTRSGSRWEAHDASGGNTRARRLPGAVRIRSILGRGPSSICDPQSLILKWPPGALRPHLIPESPPVELHRPLPGAIAGLARRQGGLRNRKTLSLRSCDHPGRRLRPPAHARLRAERWPTPTSRSIAACLSREAALPPRPGARHAPARRLGGTARGPLRVLAAFPDKAAGAHSTAESRPTASPPHTSQHASACAGLPRLTRDTTSATVSHRARGAVRGPVPSSRIRRTRRRRRSGGGAPHVWCGATCR